MTQPAPAASDSDARQPRRVRHETRRRVLTVKAVGKLSPTMLRVILHGEELAGFTSPGFDDHVKLFFPVPGTDQPAGRNYTPRRYDADAGELTIDFALHEAGPATRWAEQAQPGQSLTIGGPRGSFVIPDAYDWHLLVGDDTALPAIARRLEELPPGTRVVVLVEVDTREDEIPLPTRTNASVHWVHRYGAPGGQSEPLAQTLRSLPLPKGDFYAWVACESGVAKALRTQLLAEHGAQPQWMRASGYWRQGVADVHDNLAD